VNDSGLTARLLLASSIVETIATLMVLLLQMLNTRMGYVNVRQAVERLEHFDPDKDAHLRSIKTWIWLSVAAGFVLVAICITCFFVFLHFDHLSWTVLSNQACIVISLTIFSLYRSRVMAAIYKINMDQHKVTLRYCFCDVAKKHLF